MASLVFITGATGFIGLEVAIQALAAGYGVRLSVRKEEQIETLKAQLGGDRYGPDRLQFVVIPVLSDSAALTKALAGVDYVLHLASPLPNGGHDLKTDFIDPAVESTLVMLNAAAKTSSIKRVVITSSLLAFIATDNFLTPTRPDFVAKENTSRSFAVDLDAQLPEGLHGNFIKYHYSKLLAHRQTLDWVKAHQGGAALGFDVVTIHPTFVMGPDAGQSGPTPRNINGVFLQSLGQQKPMIRPGIVDVRDVAAIEVQALTATTLTRNADGVAELIVSSPPTSWEAIVAFVKSKYPSVPVKLEPPFAVTMYADTTKVEKELGIQWRPMEAMVAAVLDQQAALAK